MFLNLLRQWVEDLFAERDQFGLIRHQREAIVSLASEGEVGRDDAERVACIAYGLSNTQFYQLLTLHGIQWR